MVLTQRFREELRNQGREEGLEVGLERGREVGREEGLEEGQAMGREEERKAWVDWNERRVQATEEGREFNEPPPNGK